MEDRKKEGLLSDVRTLLRLATAGSVDDGKSTLVGRLLHDSSRCSPTSSTPSSGSAATAAWPRPTSRCSPTACAPSASRASPSTSPTATSPRPQRSFVLADCPGHVQYTRNTVTGSSTADALVLLVDARKGVLEQTRRHLAVAALMRVPHVVIAVNKIDLVDHSEDVFRTVAADVRAIATRARHPARPRRAGVRPRR